MKCDNCGGPVDRDEAERGTCTHCGAVLPYVLRAAEKAEIVRRVVAQGNSVRIDGDRIEASGAPRGSRAPGLSASALDLQSRRWGIAIAAAGAVFVAIMAFATWMRPAPTLALAPTAEPAPVALPGAPSITAPSPTPAIAAPEPTAEVKPSTRSAAGKRSLQVPATVDGVVASHQPQYQRCERDEVEQNPSAPRRYSVAITVDRQGQAEWVEVLSEASAQMKACIEAVTRSLAFPKPAGGSTRSIVTLSL